MEKKVKILIVDSDDVSRAVTRSCFEGFDREEFSDIDDAREKMISDGLNFFVVDVFENTDAICEKINKIAEENSNTRFLTTNYSIDPDLTIKLARSGRKEFMIKPLSKAGVLKLLEETVEKYFEVNRRRKLISVFSTCGGCGKTTIAVNSALEFARENPRKKVALVDFNSYFGDVTSLLDVAPTYDIKYAVDNLRGMTAQNVYDCAEKTENLFVYADSPYRNPVFDVSDRGKVEFLKVLREAFDFVVVDNSPAPMSSTVEILKLSDMILFITGANLNMLRKTAQGLSFIENNKIADEDDVKVVLNRYSATDECSEADVARYLDKSIFSKIPNDWKSATEAANRGVSVSEPIHGSRLRNSYKELLKRIMNG